MTITISNETTLWDIREQFNRVFPFLDLRFYNHLNTRVALVERNENCMKQVTVGQCRAKKHSGDLLIEPGMTARELESQFMEVFGLKVQVLRKSGKIWLETNCTDDWSLEKQNSEGAALSKAG